MSAALDSVSISIRTEPLTPQRTQSDIRIPALDGLRGLMTIFVVFSHFFCEVPNGIGFLRVGWVAVIVFFVLSGYLVGRLIIEKRGSGNFLPVFFLRRICRTFPTYFLSCALILALAARFADAPWIGADPHLPDWSYFVFLQNIFMISRDSYGMHWLAPTWTLALEEQFYLFAPFLFLLVPQRHWLKLLIALCLAGVVLRGIGVFTGLINVAPLALLPTSADVLCIGLVLAVLVKNDMIPWERWSLHLRIAPIGMLLLATAAQQLDTGDARSWFQTLNPFLVSVAAAFFILMLVKGAPEAGRFESRLLRFFGNISYSVYLTHVAVLGLLHGLLLGTEPDVKTAEQILVTLTAVPVTIAIGWLLTRTLEEPVTAWGRSFRWS